MLARYEFRGREALYTFFSARPALPATVAILPLYLLLRNLTYSGCSASSFRRSRSRSRSTIVILRPFLRAIPRSWRTRRPSTAAAGSASSGASCCRCRGRRWSPCRCSPSSAAGTATCCRCWSFNDEGRYTLPLGVQAFSTQYSQDTAGILAFTSLAMLPALLFFTLAERRIVGGLQGAVKG